MLPGLSPVHLLMVLVVALLVLGPAKLPELARHVGSAMHVYRELRDRMQTELSPRALVESMLEGAEPAPSGPAPAGPAPEAVPAAPASAAAEEP